MRPSPITILLDSKICPRCNEEKDAEHFTKNRSRKDGLSRWCRDCNHRYNKENRAHQRARLTDWRHRTGINKPMSESRDSSIYLGVYIAERALSKFFDNIKRMPYGNPGYDFICGKGYKIDVKSSTLKNYSNGYRRWTFCIRKNEVPDYFLLLAFGKRDSLEALHVWLVPGYRVNSKELLSIANSEIGLNRFRQYEKPIDRVDICCHEMKCPEAIV